MLILNVVFEETSFRQPTERWYVDAVFDFSDLRARQRGYHGDTESMYVPSHNSQKALRRLTMARQHNKVHIPSPNLLNQKLRYLGQRQHRNLQRPLRPNLRRLHYAALQRNRRRHPLPGLQSQRPQPARSGLTLLHRGDNLNHKFPHRRRTES